jgi:hypothetical protein
MSVTVNCHAALKRLRKADSARTLWIDAICINQRLIPERNHQLNIAAQIYSHASRVVIYIGEAADDSDAAMDWIRDVDMPTDFKTAPEWNYKPKVLRPNTDMIQTLFNRHWFGRVWVLQEVRYAREAVVICGGREVDWNSFRAFRHWNANARWVKKLPYVVQHSVFRVGGGWGRQYLSTYPKRLLAKLQGTRHCGATDERDKLFAIVPLLDWEGQKFNELKQQGIFDKAAKKDDDQQSESEDESEKDDDLLESDVTKDRLGLIPKMNYSLSRVQVFTQLAIGLIDAIGLSILQGVVTPTTLSGLPSWAPDWSTNLRHFFIGRSRRNERHHYQSDYFYDLEWDRKKLKQQPPKLWDFSEYTNTRNDTSTQLHVRAMILGKVSKLGDICNVYEDYLPLQQWESLVTDPKLLQGEECEAPGSDAPYGAYHKWSNARIPPFVKALAGGDIVYESAIGQAVAHIREYNDEESTSEWEKWYTDFYRGHSRSLYLESDEETAEDEGQEKPKRLLRDIFKNMGPSYEDQAEAIFYTCHGKRFFVTDTGRIGMAPETAEVGDIVVAIEGANALFVVRPAAAPGSGSRIVSLMRDCFVYGVKAGKVWEKNLGLEVEELIIR